MPALDPEELITCFISWVNDVREIEPRDFIAIDGKTLRRSFDRGDKKTALHVISAWAHIAHDNEVGKTQRLFSPMVQPKLKADGYTGLRKTTRLTIGQPYFLAKQTA